MVPSPANLKAAREDLLRREEVLRGRLADPDFLANRGLGNEVGIYLFCYAASIPAPTSASRSTPAMRLTVDSVQGSAFARRATSTTCCSPSATIAG